MTDEPPDRRRRALRWATVAASAAVVGHNARVALRLRAAADDHDHLLVYDGTVGPRDRLPLRLAVLGDSSATGFGLTDPDQAYPMRTAHLLADRLDRPVEVRVLAVRGARLRQVSDLQVPLLSALRPDLVLVSAGGNDVLGRRLPFQVRRDQRELVRRIRETVPGVPFLLGGTGDLGAGPAVPRPLAWVLSTQSRAVLAAQRAAALVDGVPFGTLGRQPPEHFGPDGFHAGAAGHLVAAELTVASLDQAGILDRLGGG